MGILANIPGGQDHQQGACDDGVRVPVVLGEGDCG